ncbi:tetratricopeptide repeat protein, partial [candidate division KSB1 bacterium]|nr:tetratricopeptide repeat protein [candidate division KSB1 bacterium]
MPLPNRWSFGLFIGLIAIQISDGCTQSPVSTPYFQALRLMGKQQYDQALTILKKIQDNDFGYDAADKIVEIYKIKQDFESARNYFQQIQSEIKIQGIGYFGLARIAYEQKQYAQSIEILKNAIASGCEQISIFNCLCRGYIWGNQLAEMQVYFENLLRQDSTNVNYWYGLALFYYGKFDYDTSLTLLNKLLKMVPDFRLALVWKQKIYLMTNKLRAGIEINLQLLHQAEQVQNLEQIAYHANELGRFYDNFSIHKALAYYQKSLELCTTIGMKVPQSITLGNIIGMYTLLGDARALDFLPQAIQLAREMNQPDEIGRHYLNIGVFYQNMNEDEKALEYFQQALAIFEKIEPRHEGYIANTFMNISESLLNSGQCAAALKYLKKALEFVRLRKDTVAEAKCWFRTGNIYFKTQLFDSAGQYYRQALAIFEKKQDQLAESNCWNNLGQLYLKRQDYPAANRAFQHALTIGKKLGIEKICWEAETGLAQVAEATQKYQIARQYYQQAIARIDSARDQLRIEDFQTSFMESTREIYQRWVELLLKMHDQQPQQGFEREAFYCAEKAKA